MTIKILSRRSQLVTRRKMPQVDNLWRLHPTETRFALPVLMDENHRLHRTSFHSISRAETCVRVLDVDRRSDRSDRGDKGGPPLPIAVLTCHRLTASKSRSS